MFQIFIPMDYTDKVDTFKNYKSRGRLTINPQAALASLHSTQLNLPSHRSRPLLLFTSAARNLAMDPSSQVLIQSIDGTKLSFPEVQKTFHQSLLTWAGQIIGKEDLTEPDLHDGFVFLQVRIACIDLKKLKFLTLKLTKDCLCIQAIVIRHQSLFVSGRSTLPRPQNAKLQYFGQGPSGRIFNTHSSKSVECC